MIGAAVRCSGSGRDGTAPNVVGDELLRLGRVEVAGHDQRGVARHVVGVEEVLHVVDGGRLEVLVAADHRVVVGMADRVHGVGDHQFGRAVGLVLVALAPLVAHDVALQVDLLRGHGAAEALEPVGVQPQQRRQQRSRSPRVVVGAVVAGRGVVGAAAALHQHVELVVRHACGAHEHQVLEQVGEAGAPGRLVLRADGEPGVDRDHRLRVVLVQDHGQAVGQGGRFRRTAGAARAAPAMTPPATARSRNERMVSSGHGDGSVAAMAARVHTP